MQYFYRRPGDPMGRVRTALLRMHAGLDLFLEGSIGVGRMGIGRGEREVMTATVDSILSATLRNAGRCCDLWDLHDAVRKQLPGVDGSEVRAALKRLVDSGKFERTTIRVWREVPEGWQK